MNKIIIFIILICCTVQAHSQTDSLFFKNYEQKIIENSKLKNDLQTEKQKFSELSNAYKKDTLALQKEIEILQKEFKNEKQKVLDLNKNTVKVERDNLLQKVCSLNSVISKLNKTISDRDKKIATVKIEGVQKASEENEKGKAEVLASIVNSYQNRPFDDLIKFSTKESVARDMQLVGNNPEVKPILNDLQIYFNTKELLSEKFDVIQIRNFQMQFNQIKRQSNLLDALKDDVEFYQYFNFALKKTVNELVDLDSRKSAIGDSEIQKLKFNDIVTILTDYMYNYYDYDKYPYLSDIVLEIIKRKHLDADASVSDLLLKM